MDIQYIPAGSCTFLFWLQDTEIFIIVIDTIVICIIVIFALIQYGQFNHYVCTSGDGAILYQTLQSQSFSSAPVLAKGFVHGFSTIYFYNHHLCVESRSILCRHQKLINYDFSYKNSSSIVIETFRHIVGELKRNDYQ